MTKEKEILVEMLQILEDLTTKIGELIKDQELLATKSIKGKKAYAEDKIKKRPLSYVVGAFAGGLVVGFLIGKGRK